jgi:polynucleotide 5'-hydroxyl-kinase GRC3/NOL9
MPMTGAEATAGGIERPDGWREAVSRILGTGTRRVLILGPRDAGKSTFARHLLRVAHEQGRGPVLLDADVGQKAVGPPACVTLGRPTLDGGLALAGLAFVGATDPVRGWRGTIRGAADLIARCEAGLVAVNTGGLLAGPGRRLKASKIEALEPDLLVAIGADPDLDAVMGDHRAIPAIRLAASPHARRKTAGERRSARREAFRAYFISSRPRTARLRAFDAADGPLAAPGMLVGLAGAQGRDLALGVIVDADPAADRLVYRAPRGTGPVARLTGSRLVLDDTFRERWLAAG